MESIPAATAQPATSTEAKSPPRQAPADRASRSFADLLRAAGSGAGTSWSAPAAAQAVDADSAGAARAAPSDGHDRARSATAAPHGRDGAERPATAARAASRETAASDAAEAPGDADASGEAAGRDAADGAEAALRCDCAAAADPTAAAQAAAGLLGANAATTDRPSAAADPDATGEDARAQGLASSRARMPRLSATRRGHETPADEDRRTARASASTEAARSSDSRETGPWARSGPSATATEPPVAAAPMPATDRATPAATAPDLPLTAAASVADPTRAAAPQPQAGPTAPGPWHERQIAEIVGTPAFAPALGATLAVLSRDGVQHARLQLNPAEMGPIAVQIAVEGQSARIDFHAAVAATRSALEVALPMLAGALHEAGLTLTGGGVHQQSAGQDDPAAAFRSAGDDSARRDRAAHEPTSTAAGARVRRGLVDLVA